MNIYNCYGLDAFAEQSISLEARIISLSETCVYFYAHKIQEVTYIYCNILIKGIDFQFSHFFKDILRPSTLSSTLPKTLDFTLDPRLLYTLEN